MVVFNKLKKWFSRFSDWPYGLGTPGERECEACKHRFKVIYGDLIEPTAARHLPLPCPKCGSDHTRAIELKMKKRKSEK